MSFEKKQFAVLLAKAKGSRSLNKYAGQCGISSAHISRLLREMVDTPPSPETIHKFVSVAHNGITYEELMRAAGHLERKFNGSDLGALRGGRSYEEYAGYLKEKGVVEVNPFMLESYEKGLGQMDEEILKSIAEVEGVAFDCYSSIGKAAAQAQSSDILLQRSFSSLDPEIVEWLKNPDNADYILFIHNAFKKGITRELLSKAELTINLNK